MSDENDLRGSRSVTQYKYPEEKVAEGISVLFGRTRYAILIISCICLSFALSNSLVLNFTVICMEDVVQADNVTDTHWLHSSAHVNALFSAVAVGCLLGTLPLTFIVHKYGIRGVVTIYGGLAAVATLLFPLAVAIGYPAVFIIRVIQGIPTSLSYPGTGLISSQWATQKGASTFIALLSCHMQFCSIFTMPVAGELCESQWGWRSAFYVHGLLSILAYSTFFLFYHDNPRVHRTVGPAEFDRIKVGREKQSVEKKVPYRAICTDISVLGIWSSLIGATLGFQMFMIYGPTYMNKVLGFDVTTTGFATALPYILAACLKCVLGPVSDQIRMISDKWKMVFFATLSQCAMSACFLILTVTTSKFLAQAAFTASIVFSGMNCVGTVKCSSVVCRQHVHFVLSVVSFFQCLIVLLLPVAVSYVCPNNSQEEWSRLLLGVSAIVLAASIPFVFVARGKPAAWTLQKNSDVTKETKQDVTMNEAYRNEVMVY